MQKKKICIDGLIHSNKCGVVLKVMASNLCSYGSSNCLSCSFVLIHCILTIVLYCCNCCEIKYKYYNSFGEGTIITNLSGVCVLVWHSNRSVTKLHN